MHSLQWCKEFSIRQTTLYHGQDNRLRTPTNGSVIDEFFRSFNPGLSPPRRHERLRLFLEQTGALRSFLNVIQSQHPPLNSRVLAVVDDRCDPCLKFTGISDSAVFLPVRQEDDWLQDSRRLRKHRLFRLYKYTSVLIESSHISDLGILRISHAGILNIFWHLHCYMICTSRYTGC
ncbi:hypothetical protein BDW59DRAFT_138928 [Aspergillus cavernicola]|uniref:Uncharacterized protein n=1 Tax=Aspergillus cavernicola TaxID=176166 RepID=A0ABR4IYR7_9EURO